MITICTECPHCKEEIEMKVGYEKILIGEEGMYNCPSCDVDFDYEIHVLTTKPAEPMGGRRAGSHE